VLLQLVRPDLEAIACQGCQRRPARAEAAQRLHTCTSRLVFLPSSSALHLTRAPHHRPGTEIIVSAAANIHWVFSIVCPRLLG
jgi:hypothetical protein